MYSTTAGTFDLLTLNTVILNTANLNGNDLMVSCDATDICPDTLFDLRADEIVAALGAEDHVVEQI